MANGFWPEVARHSCDTPLCVNARHILNGTHADNAADMVARGRSLKGERNHLSKLTDNIVRRIRREFKPGMSAKLARKYGVTDVAILLAAKGKTWKHVR